MKECSVKERLASPAVFAVEADPLSFSLSVVSDRSRITCRSAEPLARIIHELPASGATGVARAAKTQGVLLSVPPCIFTTPDALATIFDE